MSPVAPRRSAGLPAVSPPVIAVGIVALIAVAFALLVGLGVIDLSKFRSNEPSTAGLIAVPTPADVIPAYTRLRRDHLWDARNRKLSVIYLPPSAVTKEMLTNITDILGRVLDHQKEPGYVFTETDFLPAGTREGIVGGIPAGMRAIRVSADKVDGLYGLRSGDRFDIIATLPISASTAPGMNFAGPHGPEIALEAQLSNWDKQATVRVIVQGASIIQPMGTRGVPTYQASLGEAGTTRARPIQEAVIAITPAEVALLTEAMAVDAKLTTVPRSGRPDDPADSRTPDRRPFSPFAKPGGGLDPDAEADGMTVVETLMGQKRALVPVPRP
jgi:Flp pilus assembly protein CpaB